MAFKKHFSGQLKTDYTVRVSSTGVFSTTLPVPVVEKLHSVGIKTNESRKGDGHFEANSMDALVLEVEAVLKKYSEKVLVSELVVLKYAIAMSCSYCKRKDGEIVPNGTYVEDNKNGTCNWIEGNEAQEDFNPGPTHFGFKVFVYPRFKRTYRFPDGSEENTYGHIPEELVVTGSALEYLIAVPPMNEMNWRSDVKIKEIEYTEDLAQFFKNALLYVCKMNESFKAAFGEDIDLSKFKDLALPDFSGAKIEERGGKKDV